MHDTAISQAGRRTSEAKGQAWNCATQFKEYLRRAFAADGESSSLVVGEQIVEIVLRVVNLPVAAIAEIRVQACDLRQNDLHLGLGLRFRLDSRLTCVLFLVFAIRLNKARSIVNRVFFLLLLLIIIVG